MEENRIPFHATILTGEPAARRAKAMELTQALVCTGEKKPCHSCRDCRKAAEGIHPDVIPVERFMEEKDLGGVIKIDPIRALRNDAFIRPNEAARKVYVIDNAQNLNVNAQNALLKLLEEGPDYAAFLLLCDSAGALLETIRSRCAVVSAGQESAPEGWNPRALDFCRVLAGGSELDKAAFLAQMECAKPDRDALDGFLTNLEVLFNDAALGGVTGRFACEESRLLAGRIDRAKLLDWAASARRGLEMNGFYVSAGHLLGWLGTRL